MLQLKLLRMAQGTACNRDEASSAKRGLRIMVLHKMLAGPKLQGRIIVMKMLLICSLRVFSMSMLTLAATPIVTAKEGSKTETSKHKCT